jgi:hypothetical protein
MSLQIGGVPFANGGSTGKSTSMQQATTIHRAVGSSATASAIGAGSLVNESNAKSAVSIGGNLAALSGVSNSSPMGINSLASLTKSSESTPVNGHSKEGKDAKGGWSFWKLFKANGHSKDDDDGSGIPLLNTDDNSSAAAV